MQTQPIAIPKYDSVRENFTVKVHVDTEEYKARIINETYRMTLQVFALQIISEDLLHELLEMEEIHKNHRSYVWDVFKYLNQATKKMKRELGDGLYQEFQARIFGITDLCFEHIEWYKNMLRENIVGIIPEHQVQLAVEIRFIGEMLFGMNLLMEKIAGKRSSDYTEALNALRYVNDRIGFSSINKGKKVDFDKTAEFLDKLLIEIGNNCKDVAENDISLN